MSCVNSPSNILQFNEIDIQIEELKKGKTFHTHLDCEEIIQSLPLILQNCSEEALFGSISKALGISLDYSIEDDTMNKLPQECKFI